MEELVAGVAGSQDTAGVHQAACEHADTDSSGGIQAMAPGARPAVLPAAERDLQASASGRRPGACSPRR